MAQKVSIENLEDRGLMETEEGANLEAELGADEAAAAAAEAADAGAAPTPVEGKAPAPEAPVPAEQATAEPVEERPANERIRELVARSKAAEAERDAERQAAAELRERWARLDERSRQAKETDARFEEERQAAKRQAERPDPAIDPQAAELWDLKDGRRQDAERLAALERRLNETGQQTQASLQQQQMLNYLRDDVSRFEREHPDYNQAAAYAADKRKQFWVGLGHSEENARNIVQQETAAIVAAGVNAGRSVAQTVYGLATDWGYKAEANGNGAAAAQTTNGVTSQEKLRQVTAGQAVQGMPKTGAAAGDSDNIARMDATQIAAMSEDKFMSIMSTPAGARAMNKRMAELELSS